MRIDELTDGEMNMRTFNCNEILYRPGLYRTVIEHGEMDYVVITPLPDGTFNRLWISPFSGATEEALLAMYQDETFELVGDQS